MTEAPSKSKIVLAQVVVALMIAFVGLGLAWYGFSADVRQRIWQNLLDRPFGPLTFRFILQPIMATIAALYDGVADARTGRLPYLWTILTDRTKRGGRLLWCADLGYLAPGECRLGGGDERTDPE